MLLQCYDRSVRLEKEAKMLGHGFTFLAFKKKICFSTTVIGTELIWCFGVLLLPGIVFLETVRTLQGDFFPEYVCFWSSKRKTCFCAVMVKIKQDRLKGLVCNFWGGEYIMQCNISGVSLFFFFFFTWVKPALFPISWDCNSWNQNYIFHKCVILTATSIQDILGYLFS